jgi:uncharacterized protein YhbP (UPF0306 family)
MSDPQAQVARRIVDANRYLVLATADRTGRPWSTPVYFAHDRYRTFYWVSSPAAAHSRNIEIRPNIGGVVFDSTAPIGTGQGVYFAATATRVTGAEIAHGLAVFTRRSLDHGGRAWTTIDVGEAAGLVLWRAVVDGYWTLAKDGAPDHRVPVALA